MTQFVVVGVYIGSDILAPWVGPIRPTIAEAVEAYYLYACSNNGVDPDSEYAQGAWHAELLDAKIALEKAVPNETKIIFDAGDEELSIAEVPE